MIYTHESLYMIRLYAIPVSTSCARTRIVLEHKGLAFEELPPPTGYSSTAYKEIIPAGTVPGLIIDDFALSDSAAQVEYLEDAFPTPPMLPTDAKSRAQLRAIAAFHDTRLEPSVRALFPLVKPVAEQDSAGIKAAALLFEERLDLLDTLISPAPFLCGTLFSHVDAAFPTTIHMGMDICEKLGHTISLSANLSTWLQNLRGIPAVANTLSLNQAAVATWMASKLVIKGS